jgi:hypothetical protein
VRTRAAPSALDVARQLLRQLRRQADRGDVEERLAVDETEIDATLAAGGDDARRAGDVRRNLQGAGEIVRGAHRQDAEGQVAFDHAESGGVQGAVAAADDDAVDLRGMRGDAGRKLVPAAAFDVQRLDALRPQRLDRLGELGGAVAAFRVDDEQGAARGHGAEGRS